MADRDGEDVVESGGECLCQRSLEESDCQVVFTHASALATAPSFFCLVPSHVIQFTILNILLFTTAFHESIHSVTRVFNPIDAEEQTWSGQWFLTGAHGKPGET
jgi:hypothetical protein